MVSEKNGKKVEIYTVPTSKFSPPKKADDQKEFWHIDKEMLRFKLHYFLFTTAFGACQPYITIFAQKRIGISASALAANLTAQRCIMIFFKPGIGYLADYFNKLKEIICALALITVVFFLMFLAVPKIENEVQAVTLDNFKNYNTHYQILNTSEAYMVCDLHRNSSSQPGNILSSNNSKNANLCIHSLLRFSDFLKQCSENMKNHSEKSSNNTEYNYVLEQNLNALSPTFDYILCKVCCKLTEKCQNFVCGDMKNKTTIEEMPTSDFQTYQFWLFALISTIAISCINSFFTLTDTACCETIQKTGAQFGRQSMWGAIGWGLTCPISGLFNDYTGDFLASWIFMAIIASIALRNLTKLQIAKPQLSKNLLKDIGTVLSSKEFLAFKFSVVMNGVGTGIVWFYLFLFLTDIGGSRFLCGMVMFVQGFLGQIPFMFFSGWLIKKMGHFNVLTLSLTAYTFKFFWYSQLHNPWFVLPAEVLQGITEGLFYTNVASYAKLSSKPGTEATTQGVLFTAHEGIGMGIGCLLCGLGFDSIGGHRTMLFISIFSGCAAVISIILHLLVRRDKGSINVTPANNA